MVVPVYVVTHEGSRRLGVPGCSAHVRDRWGCVDRRAGAGGGWRPQSLHREPDDSATVDLIPVLMGQGKPYFTDESGDLERPTVVEGAASPTLRYRVKR